MYLLKWHFIVRKISKYFVLEYTNDDEVHYELYFEILGLQEIGGTGKRLLNIFWKVLHYESFEKSFLGSE